MVKYVLDLNGVDTVKHFVNIVRHYVFNIDVFSQQYVVDAKSILGIFSLDLSRPVTVFVRSNDCDELIEKLAIFAYEDSKPEYMDTY